MATRSRRSTVLGLPLAYHNPRGLSVEQRLEKLYGRAAATWHVEMYGENSAYRTVAKINAELVASGESARALALMVPVDASLASPLRLTLCDALHAAEMADALEQIPDEQFRERLRSGTATVKEARDYIKQSCAARCAAEKAEQACEEWIAQQKSS